MDNYKNLRQRIDSQYPSLKDDEKEMAIYFKLGLPSAEVANITGKVIEEVDDFRMRFEIFPDNYRKFD